MSSVNFGGPLDFGSATYTDNVTRQASNDSVAADANVTAAVTTSQSYFAVTTVTSYNVTYEPIPPGPIPRPLKAPPPTKKVYTQAGQSNGKTPLHVSKGQAVFVTVALVVPASSVTPGLASATLTVIGDTWGAPATVTLGADLISVDESTPIGAKWDELGRLPASGPVLANAQSMPDGIGSYQTFAKGSIVYSPDFGAAWLTEAVLAKLNSASVSKMQTADGTIIADYLGYPTGDTTATLEQNGQFALFERGMIIVRASGSAWAVYGAIYAHYAGLGNIASGSTNPPVVGLPASDEQSVPNGRLSQFDGGDIYWKFGTGAWEIHGAIRDRWIALGGPSSFIGYPTSDEMSVVSGAQQVGRFNTFEGGTRVAANGSFPTGQACIYWTAATGAFEVYGDIRAKYIESGGPTGTLGFPTSGETDTPAAGRYNSFQNGFIVWHGAGPYAGAFTVGNGLQLQLFSYQDTNHDDFNVQINITDSNGQVNHGRMPPGGNYGNGNQQFNPPDTLMTVNALTAHYTMDVWMLCIHENTVGSDDEDGTVTAHYTIDNLWGTADSSQHSNASFNVNLKSMPQPQIFSIDPAQFRKQLFWPFHNFDTDALSWTEFSETYTNVGEGDLGFNILPWNWHLWERAFFQFVYRGLAKGGNCFGMCLESIYAREFRTMFVEPIYDSPDNTYSKDPPGQPASALNPNDAVVVEQVNVKHGYQIGADFIQWFLGMEMANQIQDAALAFKTSRDAFAAGNWPVIMMAPDALSQDGHVVVPYQWLVSFGGAPPIVASDQAINSQPLSNQTWIMRVANPNATPDAYADDDLENEILITPLQNTWSFKRDAGTWTGAQGSGGRIFCAPFNLLSYEQGMIGDFILGLLEGLAVVIFSSNGQTQQITDEAGRTYFSYPAGVGAAPALPALPRRINPNPKLRIPDMAFVPTYHGPVATTDATDALPYEVYLVRRPVRGYQWPAAHPVQPAGTSTPGPGVVPMQLLRPDPRGPKLTFDLKVDTSAPYGWNLNCPRMSVDIATTTAANAVDRVTVVDTGSGSQTIELTTDAKAPARSFAVTLAGWRGNFGRDTKVYKLINITLGAGASLIASVSDGGKDLWIHNPGSAATLRLELYAGPASQPVLAKSDVVLDAGRIFRITPADWKSVKSNAFVYLDVYDTTTGHFVKQIKL